jgi:archaellin
MMFIMMILSYAITSYIDLSVTYHNQDRAKLIVYFMLMTVSCAIGIASAYVENMPSPADPIKYVVFTIIGR